jgi:hypothetical protein
VFHGPILAAAHLKSLDQRAPARSSAETILLNQSVLHVIRAKHIKRIAYVSSCPLPGKLIQAAIVHRAIYAPSNRCNRESRPAAQVEVGYADLAYHRRLHRPPGRHCIMLPPGSDCRLLRPCSSRQLGNWARPLCTDWPRHREVMLGRPLSSVIPNAGSVIIGRCQRLPGCWISPGSIRLERRQGRRYGEAFRWRC